MDVVAGERTPDIGLIWPDMQRFFSDGLAMPNRCPYTADVSSSSLKWRRIHDIRGDQLKRAPTAQTVEPFRWWLPQRAHAAGSLSTTLVVEPLPMKDQSPEADEKSSPMISGHSGMRRLLDEMRADISATRTPRTTHVQTDWSIRDHRRTGSRGGRPQ